MNIFYTGSACIEHSLHESVVRLLQKYGTVFAPLDYFKTLSGHGETSLSRGEIWQREQDALAKSDVVVAEVSTPSLGVGYLVAQASAQNKKVIALYHGEDTYKLSAMIKGDPNVSVYSYQSERDVENTLEQAFTS